MTLAAMFAAVMVSFTACEEQTTDPTPDGTETEVCADCGKNPCECEQGYVSPIKIDGDFADWDALDASKVAVSTTDPDATLAGLKVVKVYADEYFINVYFEYDPEFVENLESVPFHVYFNSDNSSDSTSESQWSNSGDIDYMCEGWVYEGGANCVYDPSLSAAGFTPDAYDWLWVDILPSSSSISTGAGNGTKYEFAFTLEMMDVIEFADTFGIGFDIQQAWESVGVLPNAAVTDTNLSGKAPLMLVTFDK